MRGLRPRFVAVWVIVVAALVLLPIVATALRSSRFSTSVQVFPTSRPVFGQERDPVAYLRRLLRDPGVESRVRDNVDPRILPSSLAGHVRITPFADHALVTVWSDTPERASALLGALVLQLANASADDLRTLATADLPLTEARLAASPTPPERTALVRRVQLLQQIIAKPPQALVAPPRPGPLRPPHVVDRFLDALPGAFPPRPAMFEVVLVGLALALLFSLVILRDQRKQADLEWLSPRPFVETPVSVPATRAWGRPTLRAVLVALTLGPVAGGFAYVAAYGVNGPFLDMWSFIGDLVRERSGDYSWTEVFKQHNEHRLVFPRLVMFALSGPFRLNDIPYMVVTELGFLLAAGAILWGVWRTFRSLDAVLLLGPPVAFLMFSYRQWENMLLGFNMQASFMEAFGVLALVLLYRAHESRSHRSTAIAVGAAAAALVASGSGIQGLLIWPAGILLLALLRPLRRHRLAVWVALGTAVWIAYFWNYHQPSSTRDPSNGLQHPLAGLRFFARLVGGSLAWDRGPALVVGALLIGGAIVALAMAGLRPARGVQLWAVLLVYAALACMSIASGRSFQGGGAALSSRYATYALLFVAALLVLVATLVWNRRTGVGVGALLALVGIIAWGAIDTYGNGIDAGRAYASSRRLGAFYVATYRTEPDAALARVFPYPPVVRALAPALERLHYSVFDGRGPLPPRLSQLQRESGPSVCTVEYLKGARQETSPGAFSTHDRLPLDRPRLVTLSADTTVLSSEGWCIDYAAGETAGGVYFLVDGRAYPAFYGYLRADVASFFHRRAYVRAGYVSSVVTGRLAPGRHTFALVALSHDRRRAFAPTRPVEIEIR